MASILAPQLQPTVLRHADSNPIRHPCNFSRFNAASPRCPLSSLKKTELGLCCCGSPRSETPSSGDDGKRKSSESFFNGVVMGAVKRLEDCMNLLHKLSDRGARELGSVDVEKDGEDSKGEDSEEEEEEEEEEEKDWDWRRWKEHFTEIEEQQWIASVLKMQLSDAVAREDYEAAVRLKMALHTAKESDTVGSAIHEYNKAIAQERYNDAAFLRDNAGAGLLGWWAGISNNHADVYGQIVNICAEHGRYVAKSYSSRQLAMSKPGSPLFEIYFTCGERGYKKQAVYLKRNTWHTPFISNKPIKRSARNLVENDSLVGEPSDKVSEDSKSIEKIDDDSDWINGLAGIKNMLRDVIPGVKFKAQNVIAPGKVDRDLISKDIEKITEEDEDNDEETPSSDDIKAESDMEENGMIDGVETSDKTQEQNEAPMKFVIGAILENMASDVPLNDLVRVPAELEIRNHLSFSFSVSKEDLQIEADAGHALQNKTVSQVLQRSSGHVRPDLSKFFASKEKMPIKVLVDIGELISLSMSQNQSHQLLVGTTHFNRIEIPATQDTLSGLYIGAHGMYVSEILHLKRRFGHWDEDDGTQKSDELEFYEYVEAYKLTGALSFPAGQVVFRAKVGKKNQLPHKGIIPEELNVLVRYRAQGRLADPGFQNPRWVDGELVILDGKNIRGGPVIGFVYWAPEHNFLVFFNRLRLPN